LMIQKSHSVDTETTANSCDNTTTHNINTALNLQGSLTYESLLESHILLNCV